MKSEHDERRGLPSASRVDRLARCPGSGQLEATVAHAPEEPSEDATSGTRIHAVYAGQAEAGTLTADEEDTLQRALGLTEEAIRLVFGENVPDVISREERLWLDDMVSGQPDVVLRHADTLLVLDLKTGRNETEEAPSNWQLRTLAVLAESQWACAQVYVGIVAPWQKPPISLCRYSEMDIRQAELELREVLDQSEKPGAPRIAGDEQCRYCRAKGICPEAAATVHTMSVTAVYTFGMCTAEDIGRLLDRCGMAERVIGSIRAEAKRRLEAGEAVTGWSLKPGSTRDPITDPGTVFHRFVALGGTFEQFSPAVRVTKGDLKEALRTVTKAKGKALDAQLSELTDGCTEIKVSAPSLERVKE